MNAPANIRQSFKLDLTARGYQVLFHPDESNRCPGCGKAQWLVGRSVAECASCGTALVIAEAQLGGFNPSGQRAVALHIVPSAPADKRQHARFSAQGRVLGLYLDGAASAFAIHNISAGGVMGDLVPKMADAQSIQIELEDGTLLPAELRWINGKQAGLAFLSPN